MGTTVRDKFPKRRNHQNRQWSKSQSSKVSKISTPSSQTLWDLLGKTKKTPFKFIWSEKSSSQTNPPNPKQTWEVVFSTKKTLDRLNVDQIPCWASKVSSLGSRSIFVAWQHRSKTLLWFCFLGRLLVRFSLVFGWLFYVFFTFVGFFVRFSLVWDWFLVGFWQKGWFCFCFLGFKITQRRGKISVLWQFSFLDVPIKIRGASDLDPIMSWLLLRCWVHLQGIRGWQKHLSSTNKTDLVTATKSYRYPRKTIDKPW